MRMKFGYLTYPEIYERLYLNGWSEEDRKEARQNILDLSELEFNDWIEYRECRRRGTNTYEGE